MHRHKLGFSILLKDNLMRRLQGPVEVWVTARQRDHPPPNKTSTLKGSWEELQRTKKRKKEKGKEKLPSVKFCTEKVKHPREAITSRHFLVKAGLSTDAGVSTAGLHS